MLDLLLTLSLLLSLAGLSFSMFTLVGSQMHDGGIPRDTRFASTDSEVYGQHLVETYLSYRQ